MADGDLIVEGNLRRIAPQPPPPPSEVSISSVSSAPPVSQPLQETSQETSQKGSAKSPPKISKTAKEEITSSKAPADRRKPLAIDRGINSFGRQQRRSTCSSCQTVWNV